MALKCQKKYRRVDNIEKYKLEVTNRGKKLQNTRSITGGNVMISDVLVQSSNA